MLPRREVALHIKLAICQCAVLHPIIVRRPRKHPLELQVIQWLVGQVEDGHHFLVLLALEATVVYRGNRIAGHRGPRGILAIGVLDMLERSEEHTSELQSLMRISYAVFCLKKKQQQLY